MCFDLGTATDDVDAFLTMRGMGLASTWLPQVPPWQRVVGLRAGADGAPEGEIQKLTSSFLLGRCDHMPSMEHKSLLVSLEHLGDARM